MVPFLIDASSFSWLPENVSTYGSQIDEIFWLITGLVSVVFIATQGMLIYSLYRFRTREGGPPSHFSHGNRKLEITWTFVTGAILILLALFQWQTWERTKIDLPSRDESIVVEVFAKQFEWNFRYASPSGTFGYQDPCPFDRNLHIPVGQPVLLEMRSFDVLHSLFLPHLRFKQDLVPGLTVRGWFEATRTTEVARAERCLSPWQDEWPTIHARLQNVLGPDELQSILQASDALQTKVEAFADLRGGDREQVVAEEITRHCEHLIEQTDGALRSALRRIEARPDHRRSDLESIHVARQAFERAKKLGLRWNFDIACAELCGIGHHEMRSRLIVHSQKGFETWREDRIARYELGETQNPIWNHWDRAAWTETHRTDGSDQPEESHHE